MPQRKILQTVILYRNGENFIPKVGSIVSLSDTEYRQIMAINPESLGKPEELINREETAVKASEIDVDLIAAGIREDYEKQLKQSMDQYKAQQDELLAAEREAMTKQFEDQRKNATTAAPKGKKGASASDADDDI